MASSKPVVTYAERKTITSAKNSAETVLTRWQAISKTDEAVHLTPQGAVLIPALVATEVFDLGGLEWMLILNKVAEAEPDLSDLDIETLKSTVKTESTGGERSR